MSFQVVEVVFVVGDDGDGAEDNPEDEFFDREAKAHEVDHADELVFGWEGPLVELECGDFVKEGHIEEIGADLEEFGVESRGFQENEDDWEGCEDEAGFEVKEVNCEDGWV